MKKNILRKVGISSIEVIRKEMTLSEIFNSKKQIENIDTEIAKKIIDCNDIELKKLQQYCLNLSEKYFNKDLAIFYPNKSFPSISITGDKCALNCKHCNHHYLENMIHATNKKKLINICRDLDDSGANGCLISGGFNDDAKLPLDNFLDALKIIKKNTNLILNLHTGLIDRKLAHNLGEIGIDLVSFDVAGDEYVINNIYGLEKNPNDYRNSLKWLLESEIGSIAPHICIGLNKNDPLSEYYSLSLIRDIPHINPEVIVLIAFIPTKGTNMESIQAPSPELISKIICLTRLIFPTSEISLGCMRPKKKNLRNSIEKIAFNSGIQRIVLPSIAMANYFTSKNYNIKKYNSCCALSNSQLRNRLK
ncbi:MAG: hypothetical protein GF329_13925 [Candidatus Lokiarchaeota archaeon]|nr:hypothetical protein [Candidatus Lokiarchaeota archaeon]